jgi:plasmid stabilization system protein ParE
MKIIWTPDAENTFRQNVFYLIEEWNGVVAENFIAKTEEVIAVISTHPLLYPIFLKGKRIHKCLVVKQISLYYRIFDDRIDLLIFWNNFQNPRRLKL